MFRPFDLQVALCCARMRVGEYQNKSVSGSCISWILQICLNVICELLRREKETRHDRNVSAERLVVRRDRIIWICIRKWIVLLAIWKQFPMFIVTTEELTETQNYLNWLCWAATQETKVNYWNYLHFSSLQKVNKNFRSVGRFPCFSCALEQIFFRGDA